jgi:poly(hydroxyalkanoate) depolymerase family esterase
MRALPVLLLVLAACGPELGPPTAVDREALDAVASFGSNPGGLEMFRFVPQGLPAGRPLVVLLHGCGDTAAGFAQGWSQWQTVATQRQFALVFPQQTSTNNTSTCFNWFFSWNQGRQGELQSIMQMVDQTISDVGSDTNQVYAVGFSAGGAEVANLLAAYPDRLKGVAICSGVAAGCASDVNGAYDCLNGNVNKTPAEWATIAKQADPGFSGTWPIVTIYQGLSDQTVAPMNRTELMQQWTQVHGIDQTADATGTVPGGGTETSFNDSSNVTQVQLNEIPGLDHTVSQAWVPAIADFLGLVAPGTGGGAGGGSGAVGGGSGATGGGSGTAGGTAAAGGGDMGTGGGTAAAGGGTDASMGGGDSGMGGGTQTKQGCAAVPGVSAMAVLAALRTLRRKRRS